MELHVFSLAKASVKRLNALRNAPRYPLYDSIPHTRSALRSFSCLGFPDWISSGRRGRQRFRWLMCGLVAYYTSTGERYARDKAFSIGLEAAPAQLTHAHHWKMSDAAVKHWGKWKLLETLKVSRGSSGAMRRHTTRLGSLWNNFWTWTVFLYRGHLWYDFIIQPTEGTEILTKLLITLLGQIQTQCCGQPTCQLCQKAVSKQKQAQDWKGLNFHMAAWNN